MSYRTSKALTGAAVLAICASPAFAHVIVGPRFFPATLNIEDPGVNDEMALPSFTYFHNSDGSIQFDFSADWQKRITPYFSVSVGNTFTQLRNPAVRGWQNLETAFTLQVFTDPDHEFVISAGVAAEWGKTGNASVGAESFSVVTPRVFFGKGLGDLPTSLDPLRPFAITGQLGIAIPTRPLGVTFHPGDTTIDPDTGLVSTDPGELEIEKRPTLFQYGFSLQYSLPYMNSNVLEVGGPEFLRHLIPLVEVTFATPIQNIPVGGATTLGIVAPGVIYATRYFQLGVEALIPINSASGKHVGLVAQLNLYLDDIFPDSLGRPIFAPTGFEAARTPF